MCVQVPKEARRALTLRAGVTGVCEPPSMVPGKQTLVLMSYQQVLFTTDQSVQAVSLLLTVTSCLSSCLDSPTVMDYSLDPFFPQLLLTEVRVHSLLLSAGRERD